MVKTKIFKPGDRVKCVHAFVMTGDKLKGTIVQKQENTRDYLVKMDNIDLFIYYFPSYTKNTDQIPWTEDYLFLIESASNKTKIKRKSIWL